MNNKQMKTNYQFSFNPDPNYIENKEQIGISTFLKDLFPYLSTRSVTFALLAIQVLWLILSTRQLTVVPSKISQIGERNLFIEIASNFFCFIFVGRLGSEYEWKLGSKYFLSVIIIIQMERFLLAFLMSFGSNGLIIVNNSSLVSLYVLSVVNIQKWKQNQMPEYQSKQKTVENCDLLDLNDTVIKLKTNESQFMYESYTNREFYFHNMANKEQRNPKGTGKQGRKTSKSSKFIEKIVSEGEDQLKLFKLVLCNFITFSAYPTKEFIIFAAAQATIYLLLATKALKRLVFI